MLGISPPVLWSTHAIDRPGRAGIGEVDGGERRVVLVRERVEERLRVRDAALAPQRAGDGHAERRSIDAGVALATWRAPRRCWHSSDRAGRRARRAGARFASRSPSSRPRRHTSSRARSRCCTARGRHCHRRSATSTLRDRAEHADPRSHCRPRSSTWGRRRPWAAPTCELGDAFRARRRPSAARATDRQAARMRALEHPLCRAGPTWHARDSAVLRSATLCRVLADIRG